MAETTAAMRPIADLVKGPSEVVVALETLRRQLVDSAGEELSGLILSGSLARGWYRPGRSDVNVVVLLKDASPETLDAIAPSLRAGWRAVRVEPLILTPGEVIRLVDVFPVKALAIQSHHVVLYGDDPFVDLHVDREHLRLRTEQQLRNLLLRLRRRYVSITGDAAAISFALAEAARSLAVDLATLLRLSDSELPDDDQTDGILRAAARAFDLDEQTLARMAALRRTSKPDDDAVALFGRALRIIERAVEIADRMEPQP